MKFAYCILLLLCCVCTVRMPAQVKIGGAPGNPHPSAILQLDDTSRGLLLPVLTGTQRNAIGAPQPGLLLFNSSQDMLNLYHNTGWQSINTSAPEWQFDTSRKWIYLVKPMPLSDSIYYDTTRHRFFFTDRPTYVNSLGQYLPSGNFGGKFTFKTTASRSQDSITYQGSTIYSFYEVDNASTAYNSNYTGITALATVNPQAAQKPFFVTGLSTNAVHAGADTTFNLSGINAVAYNNGIGYTENIYGVNISTRMGAASSGNIGTLYGIYNLLTRATTSPTSRIKNNIFGYYGFLSPSISTRADGTAYGIFLTGVSGAAQGNYAIYTNQGRNRFGDSTLFGAGIVPRAFFDINNTTSMIVPTGAQAQRPVTGVTGMLRFNTDNGGMLETFNGVQWTGTIRNTANIDIPLISPGTGYTAVLAVPGATTGCSVSISPTTALNDGLVIAWARVSAANTVEVRFNLLYGTAIDPAAQNYYIRVMQ